LYDYKNQNIIEPLWIFIDSLDFIPNLFYPVTKESNFIRQNKDQDQENLQNKDQENLQNKDQENRNLFYLVTKECYPLLPNPYKSFYSLFQINHVCLHSEKYLKPEKYRPDSPEGFSYKQPDPLEGFFEKHPDSPEGVFDIFFWHFYP
jgi:hypothetical protein